jgi:hypothetical protein
MNLDPAPVFITAASMTFLSIRAVVADQFRNPITNAFVLLGGIMPWFTIALFSDWLPELRIVTLLSLGGLLGSGPLFFAATIRYAWGNRFANWGGRRARWGPLLSPRWDSILPLLLFACVRKKAAPGWTGAAF